MALVLKDRVKESSTTSGTGTITLGGAFVGFQTFNSAVASGSTVYYTIHNTTAGNDQEWEVGVGTFTAPDQLTRDTVLSSSAGAPTKTNFSGSSVLEVFITQPAEEAVYINQATGKVEAFGNGTNTITFTEINTTNLTANTVTLTAGTITTNAANNTDIVNKQYVDGIVAAGVHYHTPVLVESPTALTATYNQPGGAGNGVGATLTNSGSNVALVIDGVSVSNTARVLVYQQSNAVQNGIYTVTNPGAPDPGGAQWVLTRATDADTYVIASSAGLSEGSTVFVQSGDTGAGETYTCNTQGTITFGTTNITFAQISAAQVYSAGTGLSLTNTTFSISNTAVTAAQYGNDGNVAQITVNAQGQLTNAANVAINASSITVGTLANARTTASDANGASTIVARDSTGSFTANTITATDVNSTNVTATTGSFTNISGNAATVTSINASNISSGTIANARTTGNTANSASTLVLRDSNGAFSAGNVTAANFIGAGTTITSINASNISSGTIANARTTAASANGASTIVQRDSGGNFSANTITANISGDISGGTNINASNITSGTIANARTTASSSNGASTIVLRDAGGAFAAGAITGTSFSGNGAAITAINASAITTGTLDNARTSASSANGASTIVLRDANGDFAADAITANFFIGDGSNVSAINGSNVTTGTVANARTTAASANGANTIVSRDANGSFSANVVTATSGSFTNVSGNGAAISAINASNISTGTIANARTTASDANGASTIVARDANGSFSANVGTFNTISGNGASLTAINASNISTGTIANARTSAATANGASTIVLRGTSGEFSAGAITGAFFIGDGSNVSAINGSNVTTGTVANARTTAASANGANTIVSRDANGSFTANVVTVTTLSGGAVSGNGAGLTAINASNISTGTIANARTTASDANGASTIVSRDANGSFAANVVTATTFSGGGGSISAINASNISTGTIANARTTAASANGASTIVARDASGNFTGNVVTATTFSGGGGSISAINASNLSSGTVATARLAAGTANSATYLRGDQNWATAVSNVATGTGLTGGPVTTTGTISLANTAVTPGSYTYASITVDAQGRLTAASSGASPSAFAAGTVMLFAQTAAPTGWTKNTTTGDNSALRVTTGTASTGGSVAFTTAFASQTPTGSVSITAVSGSAGSTTLSTPQIPSHTHTVGFSFTQAGFGGLPYYGLLNQSNTPVTTGGTGGGAGHTHPFSFSSGSGTFSGNAINLAVQYIDVIRATKD